VKVARRFDVRKIEPGKPDFDSSYVRSSVSAFLMDLSNSTILMTWYVYIYIYRYNTFRLPYPYYIYSYYYTTSCLYKSYLYYLFRLLLLLFVYEYFYSHGRVVMVYYIIIIIIIRKILCLLWIPITYIHYNITTAAVVRDDDVRKYADSVNSTFTHTYIANSSVG